MRTPRWRIAKSFSDASRACVKCIEFAKYVCYGGNMKLRIVLDTREIMPKCRTKSVQSAEAIRG